MARLLKTTLTPVKVRGKRRGTSAEKWHVGKRRRPEFQVRPHPVAPSQEPLRPRKRKRAECEEETPLERLPAEVLQQIFEYSANIDLPLVSRQVASKLSKSQHLRHQLTSELLRPVLGHTDTTASKKDLADATRLLNSKFVTWEFFASWLRNQQPATAAHDGDAEDASTDPAEIWPTLRPSPGLLPPKKLLSAPFTQDKINFLKVLSSCVTDIAAMDFAYAEVAYEGLADAIEARQPVLVSILLNMGLEGTTELLRAAVADAGCDEDIVRMLVFHKKNDTPEPSSPQPNRAIDLLDPVCWNWAERARDEGNVKGDWLLAFLKDTQQHKEHTEA